MTEPDPAEHDRLVQTIRMHEARDRRWALEAGSSVGRRLAQIGVLGWMIVVPMLGGVFLGRWLDRVFDSGLHWTAPLLILGLALGAWSAWNWMGKS